MFDKFPRMKYVTGLCGSALLPKQAIMYGSNLNLQSQQAIFETENTSQNFRAVGKKNPKPSHFLSEQLHMAWEEHSRKRVHIKAFGKNKVQEDGTIKKITSLEGCMPYFSES